MNKTDPPTAQEWAQLTYWKRKQMYFFARYIVAKIKIKRFIQLWTLPNFAIRQIRKNQGNPVTVNDDATEQTDMPECKRLFSLSAPEERIEMIVLMLAVIEARKAPTAANPDEERQAKP